MFVHPKMKDHYYYHHFSSSTTSTFPTVLCFLRIISNKLFFSLYCFLFSRLACCLTRVASRAWQKLHSEEFQFPVGFCQGCRKAAALGILALDSLLHKRMAALNPAVQTWTFVDNCLLSRCKPFMAVTPFMAVVLQACHGCPPNFMPAFLQSFHRYGIDNFHGHALKAFRGSSFGTCSKKFFNFFFPFTCSHLSLVMTTFPWPPCRKHARLIKCRPMPTKKHCCQDYLLHSMENILQISIKLLPLLSLACQPCLAKNLVWPLANDFFPLGNYIFFNP